MTDKAAGRKGFKKAVGHILKHQKNEGRGMEYMELLRYIEGMQNWTDEDTDRVLETSSTHGCEKGDAR